MVGYPATLSINVADTLVANSSLPFRLYLASGSPRRSELLSQLKLPHQILRCDVDETPRVNELAEAFVERLALDKAQAGWNHPERTQVLPVVGSDTAVVVDGEIIGKPRDEADALATLERLSGQEHLVMSGVAVVLGDQVESSISVSRVWFRATTEAERLAYWQSGEPQGKAGSYAIQGVGALFIESLQGSYSGVMGLPLFETSELLRRFSISPL